MNWIFIKGARLELLADTFRPTGNFSLADLRTLWYTDSYPTVSEMESGESFAGILPYCTNLEHYGEETSNWEYNCSTALNYLYNFDEQDLPEETTLEQFWAVTQQICYGPPNAE